MLINAALINVTLLGFLHQVHPAVLHIANFGSCVCVFGFLDFFLQLTVVLFFISFIYFHKNCFKKPYAITQIVYSWFLVSNFSYEMIQLLQYCYTCIYILNSWSHTQIIFKVLQIWTKNIWFYNQHVCEEPRGFVK